MQWTDELGLTRREQECARRDLLDTGVWEEAYLGFPPRVAARVRLDTVMAGLAGVLGYPLLGKIARGLIETLRKGANPLDDKMLMVAKAHLAALVALHAKDVRGEGGPAGVAVMAKLASIHA